MFDNKREVFKKIILLAKELDGEIKQRQEAIAIDSLQVSREMDKKFEQINEKIIRIDNYLRTLPREDVGMLFYIMYLGASDCHSVEEAIYNINNKIYRYDKEYEIKKLSNNMMLFKEIKTGLSRINIS